MLEPLSCKLRPVNIRPFPESARFSPQQEYPEAALRDRIGVHIFQRQAFGGGKRVLPHLDGKKTKQQNKPLIFSFEVSLSRGQVTRQQSASIHNFVNLSNPHCSHSIWPEAKIG